MAMHMSLVAEAADSMLTHVPRLLMTVLTSQIGGARIAISPSSPRPRRGEPLRLSYPDEPRDGDVRDFVQTL